MNNSIFDLTNPQKAIWLTEQFYQCTNGNNVCGALFSNEKIDFELLKEAINIFVKTNDNFRIKIFIDKNIVKQFISDYEHFDIETILVNSEEDLSNLKKNIASKPFNLLNSLLFNFTLFKFPDGHGGIIINSHHIICDSWTISLATDRIIKIYTNLLNVNKEQDISTYSYIDYINSEEEYKNSNKFIKDKEYWENKFSTIPEIANVPSSYINEPLGKKSLEAIRVLRTIEPILLNKINNYCKDRKVSLYNFFMAIYSIYISRVSNLDDFTIGTPVLNRTNFKEKNTCGMFINTLPFRFTLNNEDLFKSLLERISLDSLSMLRHQKYSYQYIIEDLRKKDSSLPNLYNIMLSYQITKMNSSNELLNHENSWTFNRTIYDDIDIHLFEWNDENNSFLNIAYDYRTEKYAEEDINNMHKRIEYIINQILDNNKIMLKDIEIVTPEERKQILYNFNNTKVDYPKDKTIVDLFEEQVEKTPDNIALVFEDKKLTYSELNEKANQLANYLLEIHLNKKGTCAIILNRSLEMIISILAVLKTGSCYIPIDPTYPEDRIKYILEDSNSDIVITNNNIFSKINSNNKINIDLVDCNSFSAKNLNNNILPDDTAYLIYTSGSTGTPKGVVISHQNVVNFIYGICEKIDFNPGDAIVSVTTMCFDIFVLETILPLTQGLKVLLANESQQNIPRLLNEICIKNNVQMIQTTPSKMQLLISDKTSLDYLNNLKTIMLGGEAFPIHLLKKLQSITKSKIYNMYGPTETTVWSSIQNLTNTVTITIGKPILNTQIYILDKYLKPCPIGVQGELYISGDGVGKGYINKPDLTKKSFINNPFVPNSIMYKTGDTGYFLPNGEIVCLGRIDNQVKIRGLRIELEEIEKQILEVSNVSNCVVVKKEINKSHEILCAYYVSEKNIEANIIRNKLKNVLPQYMVPQYFIKLDNLPYTPNGKVDRKMLPIPGINVKNASSISIRNDIDEQLINILKNLLNIESVGLEDDFFELGADSLSIINLSSIIYEKLNIQVLVKDIIENSNILKLSDFISSKSTNKIEIIPKCEVKKYYPLSSAQKRIYFACTSSENTSTTVYNMPFGIIFDKTPDLLKLEDSFQTLINENESLRTYFEVQDDTLVQKIKENIEFKIEIENAIEKNIDNIYTEFVKPFDLSVAPLFRVKLYKFENGKVLMLIDIHHIICDGTSLIILIKRLCDIYNNNSLPKEDKIDYKDFAVWENNKLNNNKFNEAKEYWVNKFKDEIPSLNMPTNYTRPSIKNYEGDNIKTKIDSKLTNEIYRICKELNVTPYMFLLSAFYVLLNRYSSSDDIIVGTPTVGREIPTLSNIIGMFVNTLALRNKINSKDSFKNFLFSVKENLLEGLKYQDYPFNELIKELKVERDLSRTPLFDIMFSYQNTGFPNANFDNIDYKYYIPNNKISKFDLSLEIIPNNSELDLRFEYSTQLFCSKFILNLTEHYKNIINEIINDINIPIYKINMLSGEEKNKILYSFNNTSSDYCKDKSIIDLFIEQTNKTPDKIALVFENTTLTYKELDEKSTMLANYLYKNGVKNGDIVSIISKRSLELIISILAILKVGAAYLPIDPTYPKNRIDYILEDSKVKFILTQENIKDNFSSKYNKISIELDNTEIYNKSNLNKINIKNNPSDKAYLIYTSGSTGNPKGVIITHQNVINFIHGICEKISFKSEDTIVSVTTMCFDIFVLETILPLTQGLKVVLANESQQNIPRLLNEICIKNNVQMIQTTPSKMQLLISDKTSLDYLNNLQTIMLGGEAFPIHLLKKLQSITKSKIYNMYGPTETTVWSSVQDLTRKDSIDIGNPISNTQMYVLNKDYNILPIGVPGDLYISGDGVSKGYLGKEDLNKTKFINNPNISSKALYSTGDLAKWLPDGNLDCLGRSDFQVKFHGLRIELEEIEKKILSFPDVINCCVCVKQKENAEQFICGYFTASTRISYSELKRYIAKFLPTYMVPTCLMQLEELEYLPNGKIDKNALPMPTLNVSEEIIAPRTQTEKILKDVWEELLSVSPISIKDNFFDLNGDSILALKLQIQLLNKNINISYSDIFKYSTIKSMAKRIDYLKQNNNVDNSKLITKNYLDYDYTKINKLISKNTIQNITTTNLTDIGNVLLVGATGFLGAHILDYLLNSTSSKVYCLVRKKTGIDPLEKLLNKLHYYFGNKYDNLVNTRLFIITSDVTDENLCLSENEKLELSNKISCVINSAALVKHYGNYSEFEKINITAVKNMINYCERFNKRFIQISTTSVSGNMLVDLSSNKNYFNNDVEFNETNLYIGQSLENYYIRSKFEAEKFILEHIINNSLNALIIRVGNITSRASDGLFQHNKNDNAFANKLKAFIRLKCIPDYLLDNYAEFTPVDCLAEAVVKSIQCYNKNINILHIYNQNHIYIKDLIKMLPDMKIVTNDEFKTIITTHISNLDKDNIVTSLINDLDSSGKLIYESPIKIKNDFTKAFLEKIGFKWTPINEEYIKKLISKI